MAQFPTLVVVGLLLAGGHVAAAGPDDEQVLVQRAAVVQPEAKLETMGEAVSSSGALEGKQDGPHTCTAGEKQKIEGEIAAWKQEYLDFVKSRNKAEVKRDLGKVWDLMHPITSALKRIMSDTVDKTKLPVRNILKFYMLKAFKPRVKYNASEIIPPLNQSRSMITDFVLSNRKSWQGTVSQSFLDFDAVLNKTEEEMGKAAAGAPIAMEMAPEVDWDRSKTHIKDYIVLKVLPVIMLDLFPVMVEPLAIMWNIPRQDEGEDYMNYMFSKVLPIFRTVQMSLNDVFHPDFKEQPQVTCQTCEERYKDKVAAVLTDEACSSYCTQAVGECESAIGKACVRQVRSCIHCHYDLLADLDNCTGTPTHAKLLSKLHTIATALKTATNPTGFDAFLNNMSHMIVKPWMAT